ncbi:spermatogenesis-associated protein 17-like [Babylonia areolata]|uniref:spermatogenesis-associated protein 17-like n=1 Tax=Babylonia areolata TaxID=304850 RepID=UPI003FD22515
MAAMVRLSRKVEEIVEDSYDRKNDAEAQRETEYLAAVKVQAWFRACRTRSYVKYLNNCATRIQKTWRGFLGRRYFRVLVKNSVFIMKLNYYNLMATYIQKMWRGYFVRKYEFNYHCRKRYLEALQVKNEIIRSELAEFAEQQDVVQKRIEEHRERLKLEREARKKHHLISTEVIPGIYNSPFLPFPTEQEYILRSVKPLPHPKKSSSKTQFDPAWVGYNEKLPKQLPPLAKRLQGPFRQPADVQKQRYKPFQPTLRVATDFYSLDKAREILKAEEWVSRYNDTLFQPFTRRSVPYEPLLHTTSKFGHLPYGSKYFREADLSKHVANKPFKMLVPPIPVFEKLNDTYSQGQV